MPGPFVHDIDPVFAEIGGLCLWWYGLSYTLGFLGIHAWFRRSRERLGMSLSEVYGMSLYGAVGVLLGGRLVELLFYEWAYYAQNPWHLPAYWLGGMATHGLLLGGALATVVYCRCHGLRFLAVADVLVIPVAWTMGIGRIGNFIDGQISGAVTGVWWAVQFPDLEGFRHPVVLYDGLKNLALIPLLIWISQSKPPRGVVFAHFLFWYAFLRLFVDLFREYRVEQFGLGMGQLINLGMAALGLALLFLFRRSGDSEPAIRVPQSAPRWLQGLQRASFGVILLFCLTIPSDWTQDIPARYGHRHPGLEYSIWYPEIPDRKPPPAKPD